jgi:hypothetical protein
MMGHRIREGTALVTSSMTSDAPRVGNPNCAETFASLRFYGDALEPEEISRRLALEPTDRACRGDQATSPSGKIRTAPTGRWILETQGQVDSTDLEQHVAWLLDRLEVTGIVPTTLPGVSQADVFCYWVSATGNGGPEFSPQTLARLARLQLTLGFDIYFAG